jgi:chromosomal replication initiation ATPase DnaA
MNKKTVKQDTSARGIARAAQRQITNRTGMKVRVVLFETDRPGRSPEDLLAVIARAIGMNPMCFRMNDRSRNIAELRFLGTLFLRKHFPTVTLKQIGTLFGGKDHSTVVYALTRAKMLLSVRDAAFTEKYKSALKSVNQWLAEEV